MRRRLLLACMGCGAGLVALAACGGSARAVKAPAPATAQTHARPQLLLFDDSECSACLRMRPAVTELEEQYGANVDFRYVDVLDAASAGQMQRYHIFGSPTVIILDSSGAVAARFAGEVPRSDVEQELQAVLGRV